eukprot:GEMP01044522.1.p1 GENE.GEMP01044522.1~~GEMP01044522.1.p1  ORF type:complete len:294 (+),score=82.49 GEMP01044522.1:197-1078(+)
MHGNQPSTLRRDSFSSRVPATPAEVYRNCSCGAGKILEDERDALEKKYESMRQRQEELADADLSMEARIYEANSEAVALASRQQACVERRCTVDAEKTIVETIMQHKVEQEVSLRKSLTNLVNESEKAAAIRDDLEAKENAFLESERELLQELNDLEAKEEATAEAIRDVDSRHASIDARIETLEKERDELIRLMATFNEDKKLLDEIECEIEPTSRSLGMREKKLDAEERKVTAEEAALSARYHMEAEAYRHAMDTLKAHQDAGRKLKSKEEEVKEIAASIRNRQQTIGLRT